MKLEKVLEDVESKTLKKSNILIYLLENKEKDEFYKNPKNMTFTIIWGRLLDYLKLENEIIIDIFQTFHKQSLLSEQNMPELSEILKNIEKNYQRNFKKDKEIYDQLNNAINTYEAL